MIAKGEREEESQGTAFTPVGMVFCLSYATESRVTNQLPINAYLEYRMT